MTKKLDVDNDGKFTIKDVKIIAKRFLQILAYKLPSSAGFCAAFYFGFKFWLFMSIMLTWLNIFNFIKEN